MIDEIMFHEVESRFSSKSGIGSKMVISTSKIKKIIPIIKKRREKGIRDRENGSNPHSKGELFSRSRVVFLLRIEAKKIMTIDRKIMKLKVKKREIIILSVNRPFHWK